PDAEQNQKDSLLSQNEFLEVPLLQNATHLSTLLLGTRLPSLKYEISKLTSLIRLPLNRIYYSFSKKSSEIS
ncbi:MAG: hypothetical protein RQ760_19350, partial [Sedimentisphaerales bacterium]|nr:hypothetical protein [Sedimentisphaerales bacterium]